MTTINEIKDALKEDGDTEINLIVRIKIKGFLFTKKSKI